MQPARLLKSRRPSLEEMPDLCRVEEVAAWADTSRGVIYKMIHDGQLASVRLGRLVRVPRSALAALVNGEAEPKC